MKMRVKRTSSAVKLLALCLMEHSKFSNFLRRLKKIYNYFKKVCGLF